MKALIFILLFSNVGLASQAKKQAWLDQKRAEKEAEDLKKESDKIKLESLKKLKDKGAYSKEDIQEILNFLLER